MDNCDKLESEDRASSDAESSAASSDSEEVNLSQTAQRRYIGRVKKCGNEYGFIECAETWDEFGRDVHFQTHQVPEHLRNPSQCLSFTLGINERGRPQAKDIKVFGSAVEKLSEPDAGQVDEGEVEVQHANRETSPSSSNTSARGLTLTRVAEPKAEPWADIDVEDPDTGVPPVSLAVNTSLESEMPEEMIDEGFAAAPPAFESDGMLELAEDGYEVTAVGTRLDADTSVSEGYSAEEPPFTSGAATYGALASSLSAQAAPFVPGAAACVDRSEYATPFDAEGGRDLSRGDTAPQLSADAPEFEPRSGTIGSMASDERDTRLSGDALHVWPGGHGNPLATMATGDRASQLSADAPEFQPGSGTINDCAPQLSAAAPEFQPGNEYSQEWMDAANSMEWTEGCYGGDETVLPPPGYEDAGDRKMTRLFANLATKMAETRTMISEMDTEQPSKDAWDSYNPSNGKRIQEEDDRSHNWKSSWWSNRDSYRNNSKWSKAGDDDYGGKWWNSKDYDHRKHDKWARDGDEDAYGKWWNDKDYDNRDGHQDQGKGSGGGSTAKPSKSARKKARRRAKRLEQQNATESSSDDEKHSESEWQRRPPPYRASEQHRYDEQDSDSDQQLNERPPLREKPPLRQRQRWQRGNHEASPQESDSDQSDEHPPLREKPSGQQHDAWPRGKHARSGPEELTEESDSSQSEELQPPLRQKPQLREGKSQQRRSSPTARQDDEEDPVHSSRVEPLPNHAGIAASVRTQRYQHSKHPSTGDTEGAGSSDQGQPARNSGDAGKSQENNEDEQPKVAPAAPPRPRPKEATVDVARFQRMALGHLTRAARPATREVAPDATREVAPDATREVAPDATREAAPNATHEVALDATSEVTLDAQTDN